MSDWKDLFATFNTIFPINENKEEVLQKDAACSELPYGCGIVFTDSRALSQKFQIPQENVLSAINQFIEDSRKIGREWILLDISSNPRYNLERDKSWLSYQKFLYDACKENNWQTDISTNLLIIGGNDVIAVPQKVFEVNLLDLKAEIDMLYCFPYGFDLKGELSHWINVRQVYDSREISKILSDGARFNVARIPLPDGLMNGEYDFKRTLPTYLAKATDSRNLYGLSNVCFSSAKSFETASDNMAKGLPLINQKSPSVYSPNGVYRSPYIDVTKGCPVEQPSQAYFKDLKNADMLLFNCHGNDVPSQSSYGDVDPDTQIWYTAFDTHIPDDSDRSILTLTCACWGARYMHYSEDTSILLKSIYKSSVLNFVGSSTIAWGSENGAYSEVLLRLYVDYLVKGYTAGEAFLRAKLEYFARFNEYKEGCDLDTMYLTIAEFNLFGDPKIVYQTAGEWDEMTSRWIKEGWNKASVSGKAYYSSGVTAVLDSVYESARFSVDSALANIDLWLRQHIEQVFSIKNLRLKGLMKKKLNGEETGYKFYYSYNTGREGFIMAITDKNGESIDISLSK